MALQGPVFGYDDILRRLWPFLRRWRAARAADPALRAYVVSADVSRAFDCVDIERLLGLALPLFRAPDYTVVRCGEGARGGRKRGGLQGERGMQEDAGGCSAATPAGRYTGVREVPVRRRPPQVRAGVAHAGPRARLGADGRAPVGRQLSGCTAVAALHRVPRQLQHGAGGPGGCSGSEREEERARAHVHARIWCACGGRGLVPPAD
jgi:hypothetical protein